MAAQHTYTVHLVGQDHPQEVEAANFAEDGRWVLFVDDAGDPVLTVATQHVICIKRGDEVVKQGPATPAVTA